MAWETGGFYDNLMGDMFFSSEKEWDNIYDIAKEADERMYKNKERYYQESKIVRRR